MKTARKVDLKEQVTQDLGDLRFRALLSTQDWSLLPVDVRRRFSKRLTDGATAIYVGEVRTVRMSMTGRVLAQVLRLMGAPLPLFTDVGVPTVVSVTEDAVSGGQIWSRMYCNRLGFPQVIHSAKRFAGPTGLEEHVGLGVVMALKAEASVDGIVFRSAGYALRLARWRLPIPAFLAPGSLVVSHRATGLRRFEFAMSLRHRWFGELVYQCADYRDQDQ